jgi:hypothetical protein
MSKFEFYDVRRPKITPLRITSIPKFMQIIDVRNDNTQFFLLFRLFSPKSNKLCRARKI